MAGQPIFILKEGSKRTRGRDAQSNNIMAAKAVAEAVRTTLGPKGMDKMLVDSMGDVIITNDGASILKEMDIEHPAAKMVVEVAKTQDEEVGDGTTSAAVVAGQLLTKAEDLIEQEIHPTIIASGYRLAADKAVEVLNSLAMTVEMSNRDLLISIAETAMTGKGAESSKRLLSEIAVDAVTSVVDTNGKVTVDKENINVVKKVGGRVEDSELIRGMIIDKERIHPNMPEKVKDAKILLLNTAIEIKDTEVDAEISITSPDQLQSFLDQEEQMLKKLVQKVIDSGANVVFCQKGIEELAQHYLAKAGIFAVRRIKKSDMEKLARATGGKLITNLDEITPEDLGYAELVEERKIGGDSMTFVTGCDNPKAVTILLRGGTEHVVDSIDSALEDALRVVGVAIEDEKLVAGGGSPEVEVALRLQEYAATLEGREQLAVKAYAEALEIIPRTLAENAGLDPIDMLMELRSQHEKGLKTAGLNVFEGKVVDMWKDFVVEPLRVKTQVINAATESAVMILRIDDVIASTRTTPGPEEGGMPGGQGGMPGGQGGMGGMPPMM
ncbi:thermosome subunit [Methanosarcina thermophila]|jgi:thermosome|uniref:Hsp60 n=3 Tax=Methanosarcina thermophila TaxID=2210 RepID=A0A1I6ZJH9_METTE|nr:thermosome subunit beta [Methanosarcina thermophila]ALK04917.1 MAG: thermosome subunit [Methanosarcina sp. 795]AKB13639.1 Heat shock protein 60 family chaperone GroEL [Methanosarcina thermophila TM-1]AKB15721.1 Heat shock protein 60 family chaperone GroEL [Methanosarcina thermophila CHTI-55]NLU58019.1 thermosome subunit [Methanosarcina thermophila]SFT62832.1 thermosome subunit [Methanosarcina thermophila]